jgi:xylan 1,4-beta-xylosidase
MLDRWMMGVAVMAALGWTGCALAEDPPAGAVVVQAEDPPPQSTHTVVEDDQAMGGAAVTSDRAWEPVFRCGLPEAVRQAPRVRVMVRRRGGPVQLKADTESGQQQLDWVWGTPDSYAWSTIGTYGREQLGEGLTLIRAGDNQPAAVVDAVALVPLPPEAPPEAPEAGDVAEEQALPPGRGGESAGRAGAGAGGSGRPAQDVQVHVDWGASAGRITPMHWGVNDYEVTFPRKAADRVLNYYLRQLDPGLVRVHHAGLADNWTDAQARDWDRQRIAAGLEAVDGFGDAAIILTVPRLPGWLLEEDRDELTGEALAEAVALMAELPGLVREVVGDERVIYYEFFNEQDKHWDDAGEYDRTVQRWADVAAGLAPRFADDPQTLIGGPALTWPNPDWVEPWLTANAGAAQFVSWHNYASGSPETSTSALMERLDTLEDHAAYILERVAEHAGPDTPTFLNEFNLQWVWQPFEARHSDHVAAVWQPAVVTRMARLGVTGLAMWHLKGNAYGLIAGDGRIRPAGRAYLLGRHEVVGDLAGVRVSPERELEATAVTRADGTRAVLLLNTGQRPVRLTDAAGLIESVAGPGGEVHVVGLDAQGQHEMRVAGDEPVVLPGVSLMLLTAERPSRALLPPEVPVVVESHQF